MRIFISSVRDGLETEREALPGLLKAIGFQPVRFEDFTAQTTPSRQACLDGVDSSDVYLLVLGPKYGWVFPETGQSATEDEYQRARTRGLPTLVFVKDNVDFEERQAAFKQQVGDYGSGRFWATFTDVSDLQTKVAETLRQLASTPTALTFEPLPVPPAVTWKSDWEDPRYGLGHEPGLAELHVVPLGAPGVPARVLRGFEDRLVSALRRSGLVPERLPIETAHGDDAVVAEMTPKQRRGLDTVAARTVRGLRQAADCQMSAWWDLPNDSMPMLQQEDLTAGIVDALRLIGGLGSGRYPEGQRYAVAAGVSGSMLTVVEGTLPSASRREVSLPGFGNEQPVRLLPDESVSAAVLDTGAAEFGRDLAAGLIAEFGRRR